VIQHRDQIQLFQVAMQELGDVVRRSGMEVNLQPSEAAGRQFEAIEVREKLPLMSQSASRTYPEDPEIEDPYRWERN
jgi:hypothetical protein